MTAEGPRTVEQYLARLRECLRGADPALIQDALYDAEEHLRAELAQAPAGDSESDVLARIVTSYGAPAGGADREYTDPGAKPQCPLHLNRREWRKRAATWRLDHADSRSHATGAA